MKTVRNMKNLFLINLCALSQYQCRFFVGKAQFSGMSKLAGKLAKFVCFFYYIRYASNTTAIAVTHFAGNRITVACAVRNAPALGAGANLAEFSSFPFLIAFPFRKVTSFAHSTAKKWLFMQVLPLPAPEKYPRL